MPDNEGNMGTSDAGRVVGVATACGPRTDNQDCALALPGVGVYAVADGMGGLADGRASADSATGYVRGVADGLVRDLRTMRKGGSGSIADILEDLIWSANEAVREAGIKRHAPARPPRSGCTLTVAVVMDDTLYVAHVGDSRAYLVDPDGARQLTEDHSVAAARVRRGRMTPEEADVSPLRNKLYQAVGISEELDVDILEVDLQPGDRVVLCSDGLWERVGQGEMQQAVLGRFPAQAAERLLQAAEQNGLVDNTTAVVIDPRRTTLAVDKPAALAKNAIFADFDTVELQRLAPYFELRTVEAGEVLVREGDRGDSLFVLGAGRYSVTRAGVFLVMLEAPSHMGDISLLRGGRRTATVVAETAGWVLRLHRDPVHALIRRQPELGARLALRLAQHLAERVVDLTERVARG